MTIKDILSNEIAEIYAELRGGCPFNCPAHTIDSLESFDTFMQSMGFTFNEQQQAYLEPVEAWLALYQPRTPAIVQWLQNWWQGRDLESEALLLKNQMTILRQYLSLRRIETEIETLALMNDEACLHIRLAPKKGTMTGVELLKEIDELISQSNQFITQLELFGVDVDEDPIVLQHLENVDKLMKLLEQAEARFGRQDTSGANPSDSIDGQNAAPKHLTDQVMAQRSHFLYVLSHILSRHSSFSTQKKTDSLRKVGRALLKTCDEIVASHEEKISQLYSELDSVEKRMTEAAGLAKLWLKGGLGSDENLNFLYLQNANTKPFPRHSEYLELMNELKNLSDTMRVNLEYSKLDKSQDDYKQVKHEIAKLTEELGCLVKHLFSSRGCDDSKKMSDKGFTQSANNIYLSLDKLASYNKKHKNILVPSPSIIDTIKQKLSRFIQLFVSNGKTSSLPFQRSIHYVKRYQFLTKPMQVLKPLLVDSGILSKKSVTTRTA